MSGPLPIKNMKAFEAYKRARQEFDFENPRECAFVETLALIDVKISNPQQKEAFLNIKGLVQEFVQVRSHMSKLRLLSNSGSNNNINAIDPLKAALKKDSDANNDKQKKKVKLVSKPEINSFNINDGPLQNRKSMNVPPPQKNGSF